MAVKRPYIRGGSRSNGNHYVQNGMLSVKTKIVSVILAGATPPSGDYVSIALAANTTAQNFALTDILPAKACLISALIETEVGFSGGVVSAKLGTASAGVELIALTTMTTAATLAQPDPTPATALIPLTPIVGTNKTLYLGLTRSGANWSALTTGKLSLKLTFIDYAGVKP